MRRPSLLPAGLVAIVAALGCATGQSSGRSAVISQIYYHDVIDNFRWLEDETQPEVQAWMKDQDTAARAVLDALPGRDRLIRRFGKLYYVDSISPPVHRGSRSFYVRTRSDKEKAIVYWKQDGADQEHVLLDPNAWSADGTISLGEWVPSWDGRQVVFGKRENGEDEATLRVIAADSGEVSAIDVIPGGKYAVPSWTPDSTGFYYEWLPVDPGIPVSDRPGYTEIRFHRLGTDPSHDRVVHERTGDPRIFLGQSLSRDGRYLFVSLQRGWNENDLWMRDLQAGPDGKFQLLVSGHDAQYSVIEWEGQLYFLTDEGTPRGRVLRVPAGDPARGRWKEIIPEDREAALQDFSIVGGRLALSYLKDVASELRTTSLDGSDVRRIPLPALGSSGGLVGNPDEPVAFLAFSSFLTPTQIFQVDLPANTVKLWAEIKVPIDPSRFVTEQVFFHSKDGTRVPMFIIHARDAVKDGNRPTILYGYGGFEVNLTPAFRPSIYPWLEAGGVYAIANLRGGAEYGKAWHDAGKGAHKQNVFDDFAAAAEYLEHEGWTKPARLGINGGSNGGLLVGVAMTQHPDLYGAVVCQVPLLDMVRYHLFGSGKTWIPEYGNPDIPEQLHVLLAYSPYHHVQPGVRYPPLLMMSADHDDRVDPMHARKFTALLEAAESSLPNPPPVLLRIERQAGHHGADLVKKSIEMSADMYAFFMAELGVTGPSSPSPAGAPLSFPR